jgi:hypothetical protein
MNNSNDMKNHYISNLFNMKNISIEYLFSNYDINSTLLTLTNNNNNNLNVIDMNTEVLKDNNNDEDEEGLTSFSSADVTERKLCGILNKFIYLEKPIENTQMKEDKKEIINISNKNNKNKKYKNNTNSFHSTNPIPKVQVIQQNVNLEKNLIIDSKININATYLLPFLAKKIISIYNSYNYY